MLFTFAGYLGLLLASCLIITIIHEILHAIPALLFGYSVKVFVSRLGVGVHIPGVENEPGKAFLIVIAPQALTAFLLTTYFLSGSPVLLVLSLGHIGASIVDYILAIGILKQGIESMYL